MSVQHLILVSGENRPLRNSDAASISGSPSRTLAPGHDGRFTAAEVFSDVLLKCHLGLTDNLHSPPPLQEGASAGDHRPLISYWDPPATPMYAPRAHSSVEISPHSG